MSNVLLRLGPLEPPGFKLIRSGIRWLCEEGHVCRPGEPIAFCNVALGSAQRGMQRTDPFVNEMRDFQVAFAPRVGGRVSKSPVSSRGGLLDLLAHNLLWTEDFVIGRIDDITEDARLNPSTDETLELLFLAGRRVTELAESRSGLLTGWHDRSRVWWGNGARYPTILSLGICELSGVMRGDRFAFLDLFDAMAGPVHILYFADDILVPCARVVLERLTRTREAFQEIQEDFARTLFADPTATRPKDWIFAAALLSALQQSPMTDTCDLLDRAGLKKSEPPDAVILSLNSEASATLRHKRLGYTVLCHRYRLNGAGPRIRNWLQTHFEPVRRSIDDIRRDYGDLIQAVRAKSNMKIVTLNVLSTSGDEDIHSYAAYDAPLGSTISSIRAKELNLMLHDLAREHEISIVDMDAITAEIGAALHLPDAIHGSGLWQKEVRGELLRTLRQLGIGAPREHPLSNRELHRQGA